MPSSKANEVARFISAMLSELYPTSDSKRKAPGEWAQQKIADELGIKKPQIAKALLGPHGIGQKFEKQFAAKHFGGSIDRLREAAARWAETHPAEAQDAKVAMADATGRLNEAASLLAATGQAVAPEEIHKLRAAVSAIQERLDELPVASTPARAHSKKPKAS